MSASGRKRTFGRAVHVGSANVRFRPIAVIALQAHGGRMEHMGLSEEVEQAIEGLSNEGGAHDVR